ncbi:hypothetical protein OJ998_04365, partial [Solirubrobacter taibaiensis]|nr:hypothetical protein [Solirubrobacter taibaiensis]
RAAASRLAPPATRAARRRAASPLRAAFHATVGSSEQVALGASPATYPPRLVARRYAAARRVPRAR